MKPTAKAPLLLLLLLIQGIALAADNTANEATELKINQQTVQCIADIKSELFVFSKDDHPVFMGIEKEEIKTGPIYIITLNMGIPNHSAYWLKIDTLLVV